MSLYTINNGTLSEVKERPFKLEREIQRLFEASLPEVMGLEIVKSELTIKNKRIDTLAFDHETKSFVIIEYKRDRNSSVVDQGFAYLGLMLENKDSFIIEYNETHNKTLRRSDVDWSQTRVAFVAPSFTENQIMSTNFKDLSIELWEVKRFVNDTVIVNPIRKTTSAESIKSITTTDPKTKSITDEIQTYTEEMHLEKASEEVKELYAELRNSVLGLANDIEVKPRKLYVAFREKTNLMDVEIRKTFLKLWINAKWGEINDAKGLAKNVSGIGHWGNGDYEIHMNDDAELEYVLSLVREAMNLQ